MNAWAYAIPLDEHINEYRKRYDLPPYPRKEDEVNKEITISAADGRTYKMVPMVIIPRIGDTMDMSWQDEGTPGQIKQAHVAGHVAGHVAAVTWTAPYAVTVKLD